MPSSSSAAAKKYERYHSDAQYRESKIKQAMHAYAEHGEHKRAVMRAYYAAHRPDRVVIKQLFKELPASW